MDLEADDAPAKRRPWGPEEDEHRDGGLDRDGARRLGGSCLGW